MVVEKLPVAELDVRSVWDRLEADTTSVLIDVRTRAEWTFVGLPDLTDLNKQPLLIEWQSFPANQPDPDFAAKLEAELVARGVGKTTNLFFICRSGARSLSAARAMAGQGYSHCHNVTEGFEGPVAPPGHAALPGRAGARSGTSRQRGTAAGWKAAGLPWSQS